MLRSDGKKAAIIETLASSGRWVSGRKLGDMLNMSRVAVWKHINDLRRLGYVIESSRAGYRLIKRPDKPYPWELGGVRAYYVESTGSTMDVAKALAERGEEQAVVIAGRQEKGRGRMGRSWLSPEGGFYTSLILRPRMRVQDSGLLARHVASRVAGVLGSYGVKPDLLGNNFYFRGRKLGGVLVEVEGELDVLRFAIVGIGVNVNNPVPEGAVSLREILGRRVSLLDFARRVVEALRGMDVDKAEGDLALLR
ncbi:MAG: biotin--[acetyl-CoA-carboxylase] ligase [Thermococci archaeon]|nr:biotin--[acetyl-CoA-carboxylase] ligase [Thermococci archaeon]